MFCLIMINSYASEYTKRVPESYVQKNGQFIRHFVIIKGFTSMLSDKMA